MIIVSSSYEYLLLPIETKSSFSWKFSLIVFILKSNSCSLMSASKTFALFDNILPP